MTCPICHQNSQKLFRPFCSKRCADLDLGNWLTGKYSIAVHPDEEDDAAAIATAESPEIPH